MKLRKKLMVWGAFLIMGLVLTACAEESYFDSIVAVEDTSSDGMGLGDGSGDSSVGNVHVVKNSVGDAISDLFGSSKGGSADGGDSYSGGGSSYNGGGTSYESYDGGQGSGGGTSGFSDSVGGIYDSGNSSGSYSSSSSGGYVRSYGESGMFDGDSSWEGNRAVTGSEDPEDDSLDISDIPEEHETEESGTSSKKTEKNSEDTKEEDSANKPVKEETSKQEEKEETTVAENKDQTETPAKEETPSGEAEVVDNKDAKEISQDAPKQEVKEETPKKSEPTQPQPEPEPASEEITGEVNVTIMVMNESEVACGMICVIDPYTENQLRVGGLQTGEMFIFNMTWPLKEKHFRIAVYDMNGEILKADSIDFAGITTGCVVRLVGGAGSLGFLTEVE